MLAIRLEVFLKFERDFWLLFQAHYLCWSAAAFPETEPHRKTYF